MVGEIAQDTSRYIKIHWYYIDITLITYCFPITFPIFCPKKNLLSATSPAWPGGFFHPHLGSFWLMNGIKAPNWHPQIIPKSSKSWMTMTKSIETGIETDGDDWGSTMTCLKTCKKTPHFGWLIHVLRIQSTGLLASFKSPFVDTCCALSASVYEESPSKSLAPSRWFFSSCNGPPSKYLQLSHLIPFVRLVNHGQSMSPCSKGGQDLLWFITWDLAKISPSEGSRATSCAECSESFSWRCWGNPKTISGGWYPAW